MPDYRLQAIKELQVVTGLIALLEAEAPNPSAPLDQARAALYAAKGALAALVGPATPNGPSENTD